MTTSADPTSWPRNASALIGVSHVANFTITGGGGIDGGGSPWWKIRRLSPSEFAPKLVEVSHADRLHVSNIVLRNSPMFHLPCSEVTNAVIEHVQVLPEAAGHLHTATGMAAAAAPHAHPLR